MGWMDWGKSLVNGGKKALGFVANNILKPVLTGVNSFKNSGAYADGKAFINEHIPALGGVVNKVDQVVNTLDGAHTAAQEMGVYGDKQRPLFNGQPVFQ